MVFRFLPQLPLLRRELTELANRPRTYVIRLVGAIALLTVVFLVLRMSMNQIMAMNTGGGPFGGPWAGGGMWQPRRIRFMGVGGAIFQDIVPWLFRSIQLLMPALCCGTITMEKERNTLGTLFLTRLSPLAIILEKLGSRLIPMLTFLLLTFPVLAYVYSLGGVDTRLLVGTLWLLLCECLLYASIGMLCSSWFRTTVSSFICSYVLVLLLVMSSAVLGRLTPTPYDIWLMEFHGFGSIMPGMPMTAQRIMMLAGVTGVRQGSSLMLLETVGRSVPALLVSVCFLLLARVFLFRRAFVTSSSPILRLFRVVDGFFVRLNDRTTRGIELIKDSNSMPAFDPIAWRERTRKSLGKARYLFRVLTVLEVPTMFICAMAAIASAGSGFSGLRVLLVLLWVLTLLVLTVKASTAISGERARETIEPLLSTPMTAAQILREKIIGMRRLMIVLSIPILTVHGTLLLLHVDLGQLVRGGGLTYVQPLVAYSLLTIPATFNTMLLVSWFSAGVGMRYHSQMKSVLVAVTCNAVWLMLPLGIAMYIALFLAADRNYWDLNEMRSTSVTAAVAMAGSPVGPVWMNEGYLHAAVGDRYQNRSIFFRIIGSSQSTLVLAAAMLLLQIAGCFLLRGLVLRVAPRLLNRRDDSIPAADLYRQSFTFQQSQPAV